MLCEEELLKKSFQQVKENVKEKATPIFTKLKN